MTVEIISRQNILDLKVGDEIFDGIVRVKRVKYGLEFFWKDLDGEFIWYKSYRR